jgi:short-subunit dehydrogenase
VRIGADDVVIVTGASEGIGRALSLELAERGVRLVLAARNQGRLDELAELCEARGASCLAVATDVGSEPDCRALVDRTIERWGRIDVLVNNAGLTGWARVDELADSRVFEELLRVNYLGAAWLTRHALPSLLRSQGRIVAIASVAGLTGVPERAAYAASKHAMIGFFESLRIELADRGVTVTIIAPDFVRSEIHRRALGADGQPLGSSPMQERRIMTAEDCARRIVTAIDRRERLVVTSMRGRFGRWFKLIHPALVDRIAASAIRNRY